MRLDKWLFERHYFESREKAKQAIDAGVVKVDDQVITKSSTEISDQDVVTIISNPLRYVSRGGYKLEKAIREFQIDLKGKTVLDIGASTGGFTDCALQSGAEKVFAIDVGKDQLHESLRHHSKVISLEKTDIRKLSLEQLDNEPVEVAVADLSFISLKKIFPEVKKFLKREGVFIALVKPQFETGERKNFKKGIVKDEALRKRLLNDVLAEAAEAGFYSIDVTETDTTNDKKNIEYLIYFSQKKNE